jgi:type I restriction enzyme S subunit
MTTVPSITKTKIEKLSIPLPPLNEQVKIAEILSKVDDAIKNIDNAIARLERLKRGLMSELLTGRIRVREENGRLSFYRETELQETEIGEIPRGWHVAKLGELIEMNHGERPEVILQEGDVPIYGGGGLYGFTNTYLVDKPYVLILARVGKGSVGKVYLARGRVWVTDNAIYGYSKDPNGITTVYAYYWLLFDKTWIEKYVRRSAGGYAIITLNSLNNLKLPLPPLNEQKGITKILSTIDKAVDLHYKGKERLERLKRSLMDLLLTGKVRVVDGDVGS